MEKLTVDLSSLYSQFMSPTNARFRTWLTSSYLRHG